MKYLSEIAQIVTRLKENKIEIIDDEVDSSSTDNISKFYYGIKSGAINSDSKAAEVIYGSPVLDTKYTSLKNRLKKKLTNSLFFLNITSPEYSEYTIAYYKSNKDVFIFKTLARLGARNSAIKISESALKHAQKYNLTSNCLEFLLSLRNYSRLAGSEKEYDKYDKLFKHTLKMLEAECTVLEFYERLTLNFARSSAEQPELLCISKEYAEQSNILRKQFDSFDLTLNYFRLQSFYDQISQDYQDAVRICEEAEKYLTEHSHLSTTIRYGEFEREKLSCYLNLREYEKGKKSVLKCSELYPNGTNNWFIFMELYFYLTMHTEHFSEAEAVYNEVTQHPRYTFQPEYKKESWKLLELYMRFALKSEQKDQAQASANAFDLKKFLRAVPSYKGDKRGYNVAILIFHILYLLDNNDFGDIIGRMDALRTYRTRYLRVTSNKQSTLFFRMLQIMETNNFSYEITKQKSQKYYDKMVSMNAEYTEIQDGLQVLPFDWLWRKILEMLKQKEEQGIIQKVMN